MQIFKLRHQNEGQSRSIKTATVIQLSKNVASLNRPCREHLSKTEPLATETLSQGPKTVRSSISPPLHPKTEIDTVSEIFFI